MKNRMRPPESLTDFGEDQLVGDAEFERQHPGRLAAFLAKFRDLFSGVDGELEDLPFHTARFFRTVDDLVVRLLKNTWCCAHERRFDDRKVGR